MDYVFLSTDHKFFRQKSVKQKEGFLFLSR